MPRMNRLTKYRSAGGYEAAQTAMGRKPTVGFCYASKSARGFTLFELMITLVVAAILATVAVPNMRQFVQNSRLQGELGELAATLNFARGEAAKRSRSISVCARASDTACGAASAWKDGWLVFIDVDTDGVYDGAPEEILRVHTQTVSAITVTANDGKATPTAITHLRFAPAGNANNTGAFTFCDDRGGTHGRNIKVAGSGGISVTGGKVTCP